MGGANMLIIGLL